MRRLPILTLSLVTALAIAACSSGGTPGWTYAPAPSVTPAASGAASGAPSAAPSVAASAAPSVAASVAPSVAASVAPSAPSGGSVAPSGGAGLTVSAPVGSATSGFVPTTLETAAGTAFSLTFDNQDNTVPHNLVLQNPDKSAVAVQGDTAIFTGPGQRVYQVPALTAGAYPYVCQVHPTTMTGTLTVQ